MKAPHEDLEACRDDDERRRLLARRPELRRREQVEALCARVTHLLRVDLEQAARLAETACWLAEQLGEAPARARAERSAANALHFVGESRRAQELYGRALTTFEDLGDDREAAVTRSSALLNLAYLGDYRRMQRWAERARAVFERLGDRERLANLRHNVGTVLYRQDRWREALEHYLAAHAELVALDRRRDAAVCLRNIAVCHVSLLHFEQALDAYERNRAYCREHGLERMLLEIDYNIAYLYYQRGEYNRALELFGSARRRCQAAGDDYHEALCDLDQAEIFLELNLVEEAASRAQAALDGFERLKVPYETAKALTFGALALSRQGHAEEGLGRLGRARRIFEREDNQLWPALIDFYRAVVLYRERRYGEAIALAEGSRDAFARLAATPRAVTCALLVAELQLELGEVERARDTCHEALASSRGLGLPVLEHKAYQVLGRVEETLGDRRRALEAFRRSQGWLEQLRSQLQGEDLKIAFLEDKQAVYESLVWLTMSEPPGRERDAAAFEYVEKAKSRGLVDLLAFRSHALPPRDRGRGQPAARVRALREELSWLYRQVDLRQMRGASFAELESIRRGAREKEDELLRALRELGSSDRELSSLQSAGGTDLENLGRSLPADALLVEYFIARQTIFVCVLDRGGVEVLPLAPAHRAREHHRSLQLQLSRLARGGELSRRLRALVDEVTRHHAGELYRLLLAPIRERLEAASHLVVVPHGFLHYVPFHALWDGGHHLVDLLSVSYAPSAEVFGLCAAKETVCEDRSLVLGVADERAPEILEEARAVAESLPRSTLLLGAQASEEALRRHAAGCRYVHLATHGLFRRDNPMFSAIQLGTSRLSLFDLYHLRLDAELVVLSGCGTGLAAVVGADELVGLTRGLLYAGARSALVTLWDVHDASTACFMRRFYRHLGDGCGGARALRLAMLDLRERQPHPYHWAPFVLVGQPGN